MPRGKAHDPWVDAERAERQVEHVTNHLHVFDTARDSDGRDTFRCIFCGVPRKEHDGPYDDSGCYDIQDPLSIDPIDPLET